MTNGAFKADCGHMTTPSGIAAGHVVIPGESGNAPRTACYPCADAWQRERMAEATEWTAYVSETGATYALTTWSGGKLADAYLVSTWTRYGKLGSITMYAWHFVTPDGRNWHGRNTGPGMAVVARVKRVTR